MISRTTWVRIAGIAALLGMRMADAADPFHTVRAIPSTPAGSLLAGQTNCAFGAPGNPFSLEEAIERALCENPETRNAWALVELRAAAVGVSRAAYLPTLSANGEWVHDDSVTKVRSHPELSSNYATPVHSGELSLGWVLYDFGSRRATLANTKALLTAAQANEDAESQQIFASAAKAYYAAQTASEQLHADAAITADAKNSLNAAKERVDHGAAPNTESYQAETAYEQALLTQNRDQGQAWAAQGDLAQTVALAPDTPLHLNDIDETLLPNHDFQQSVSDLMAEAALEHPAIIAAQKELEAAQAGVTQAKTQGQPTIKLVGQYSENNQPVQLGLGLPHYPATGHDGYVGVQVSIPLFTGFSTTYQVRQAQAEVDQQAVALDKTKQQVALQVWKSYQTLQTDTQNLAVSERLQIVAANAWASAQRRYRSGAGTILELLSTQTALAQARQQRVEALTAWRYDRLALASALGQLKWRDVQIQR
jgi:outer membrane protein